MPQTWHGAACRDDIMILQMRPDNPICFPNHIQFSDRRELAGNQRRALCLFRKLGLCSFENWYDKSAGDVQGESWHGAVCKCGSINRGNYFFRLLVECEAMEPPGVLAASRLSGMEEVEQGILHRNDCGRGGSRAMD